MHGKDMCWEIRSSNFLKVFYFLSILSSLSGCNHQVLQMYLAGGQILAKVTSKLFPKKWLTFIKSLINSEPDFALAVQNTEWRGWESKLLASIVYSIYDSSWISKWFLARLHIFCKFCFFNWLKFLIKYRIELRW